MFTKLNYYITIATSKSNIRHTFSLVIYIYRQWIFETTSTTAWTAIRHSAHRVINAKLLEEKLPSLNYRIDTDYGEVRMQSSNTDDLFGAAMNKCAKINSKAPPNGIVIGEEIKIIRQFEDKYLFITVDDLTNWSHSSRCSHKTASYAVPLKSKSLS